MKFKYFYKLVDCCQRVSIDVYYGTEKEELSHFEGYISDAPIHFGEYTLYGNEDGEAICTSAKENEHGVLVTTMHIDLQSKRGA